MKNNRKKFIVMAIVAMMFSLEASAQVYSSGGGDSTDYKSTIGYLNTATGKYSLAAGRSNQTTGQASFALGYQNTASGNYSFSAGRENKTAGSSSIALGLYNMADGLSSVAIGMYTHSREYHGITIGHGFDGTKPLINNTDGIMFGAGSNLPTLFISAKNSENRTGKVGIGNVTDPQAKLHIKGDAIEDADILLVSTGANKSAIRFRNDDNSITVGSNNVMCINALSSIVQESKTIKLNASNNIQMTSKVGINTVNTNTGYALAVSGGILTDQVLIRDVSDWPDYVFGKGHALMSINNVKAFIDKNHHLPDVPSAKEVEENGVNVAEMQKVLLKKIEELTLYTIEQQRLIEELQEKIERLENQ